MKTNSFFFWLTLLTLILVSGLWFLHSLKGFDYFFDFSMICLAFFIFLSLVMFFLGKWAAASSNKNLFTAIVIFFVFGKLVFSLIILLTYHKLVQPVNGKFLIPFFIIYLFYTVFETVFMMRLGKLESKQ